VFERYYDIINYLFPLRILRIGDTLSIEDRRPTLSTFVSALCFLGFLAGAAVTVFIYGFTGEVAYWVGPAAGWLVSFLFAINGTFREIYVFDKPTDTYTFTRQSVLKKDVLEGSLSQFRAVQLERRTSDDDDNYMVALLMQGMLLGQPDTQILRENPPAFNNYETEERIAQAISSFLNIKQADDTDIL
jgi:hypothetical protein